jgi:Fungal Zn(2)-Cys(6) binuclear cluster domain
VNADLELDIDMPRPQGKTAPNKYTTSTPPKNVAYPSLQVRCDAASLGVPCTNCTAFGIECRIPTPKRKKTGGKEKGDE